jgi:hypothetical protein
MVPERGLVRDDLRAPREKQALYNYQRKSQVYRKDL